MDNPGVWVSRTVARLRENRLRLAFWCAALLIGVPPVSANRCGKVSTVWANCRSQRSSCVTESFIAA